MKALTIMQPWASLIAVGAKLYETRSYPISYRGQLAIHASRNIPEWAREELNQPNSALAKVLRLKGLRFHYLPRGCVIAVVTLLGCARTEQYQHLPYSDMISSNERAFGDWTPGRWAWQLADIKRLSEPIPARGALRLWDWEPPKELDQ